VPVPSLDEEGGLTAGEISYHKHYRKLNWCELYESWYAPHREGTRGRKN